MTKEEVAKVKRNLKKHGFSQPKHKELKGIFFIKLHNDCQITVSFREPMPNTYFMSVTMDLDDDYELGSSILDYEETNPQRFCDMIDNFNAALKFINR